MALCDSLQVRCKALRVSVSDAVASRVHEGEPGSRNKVMIRGPGRARLKMCVRSSSGSHEKHIKDVRIAMWFP
jgi:hypothetical protein